MQKEYMFEDFKKQFEHGKCDDNITRSEYRFYCFVVDEWYEWIDCLRKQEQKQLEKTHSYKGEMYLCRCCGKKKKKELFFSFDKLLINGNISAVYVRNGTGECSECVSERHKEEMREYKRKWYQEHKEEISEKQKQRRAIRNEQNRKYSRSHRDQINEYVSNKKKSDPIYRLKCQARKTVYMSFARTGNVKSKRCEDITGLCPKDLAEYLIHTYEKNYGIAWDGESPVHIDHIIPLATAQTEEEVMRLCNYSNLQLLKPEDNLHKGAKLNYAI